METLDLWLGIDRKHEVTTIKNQRKIRDPSWDFTTADTKILTHGIHPYPAMMIPQVARRLINLYGNKAKLILDPFCGSGTVLVEAKIRNVDSAGIDINPLAILLSKVKTTPLNPKELRKHYEKLIDKIKINYKRLISGELDIEIPSYKNIEYWFKSETICSLVVIKQEIMKISDQDIRDFFLVGFSETIRKVSLVKKGEFKLVRMPQEKIKRWNPNPIRTFAEIAMRNIRKMSRFYNVVKNNSAKVMLFLEDTRKRIPVDDVDLIVTSPPYGDSRTTVAYGQFSRLSLQWLDFDYETIKRIDRLSLGGKPVSSLNSDIPSTTLEAIIHEIAKRDEKRARDVLSYFVDFYKVALNIDASLKYGGYICFVVGNRTVKGIRIPTDEIYVEIFKELGYIHEITIVRKIPNKSMPLEVSPSNIPGQKEKTMHMESIVILRKS